jgi:dihydrolipoamide dehydrogenase
MATSTPARPAGGKGSPYDIAVIGAGPGGYVAAIRAAQMGARVLVIEKGELGGTCLNRGCIPTKGFLSDVKPFYKIKKSPLFRGKDHLSLNMAKMVARKNEVVETMVKGIATLFSSNGVHWVRGVGSFLNSKTIGVIQDGKKRTYKANNTIIATGSTAAKIPTASIDGRNVLSGDEVLNIRKIPEEMVVIGGGVTGLEVATIFNALGTQVTIVEMLPTILSTEDDELIRGIHMILEREGIKILTDTRVTGASSKKGKVEVKVQDGSAREAQLTAEKVLVAVGRTPHTEGLALESIGLKMNGQFIEVNPRMETNVDGVYAVGDVIGKMMLAHAASAEGVIAVENIMGGSRQIDYRRVPSCVYTFPEIASVGLKEREARESGRDIRVGKFPYPYSAKAMAMGELDGFVKIIAETELGEILGVHILAENATDLIGECILAMNLEATIEDLGEAVKAHPTLSETITEAALDWRGISIHQPPKEVPSGGH